MADELCALERALGKLRLPYSLALRLRDAGVAELVCEYVGVEEAGLVGFCRVAEAKLVAAKVQNSSPCEESY